jgi:recombinational DNA repair protein (RecF pathway)
MFRDMTPCSLVGVHRHFGGKYCLQFKSKSKPSKQRFYLLFRLLVKLETEVVRASETWVNYQITRRFFPEHSSIYSHRSENFTSHNKNIVLRNKETCLSTTVSTLV